MNAMQPLGEALARSLVNSLGSDCAAAAALAHIIVARQSGVIDSRSVGIGPTAVVARVSLDFIKRGWLVPEGAGWRIGPHTMPQSVPAFLEGAASMRMTLSDEAKALAIVTLPLAPSAIERALPLRARP